MTLLEHIESYLGETEGGWRDPPGEQWPFYVLQFNNGPISKATVFSTLGLSEFELASPFAGRTIRHELIFMAQSGFGYRNIPAILHDVGTEAISRGRAYLCGEVIGPRGKLFPDSQ